MAGEVERLPWNEGRRRATVTRYFDRGLDRSRRPMLPTSGRRCVHADGVGVRFSLEVSDGVIRSVAFTATTCVVLVAYSELLSESVTGKTLREAMRITPAHLTRALAEVPLVRQSRAVLPVRALRAAIAVAVRRDSSVSSTKGGIA